MPMMIGGGGDSVNLMPSDSNMASPTQEASQYAAAPVDYSNQGPTQEAAQYATPVDTSYATPVYQPSYAPVTYGNNNYGYGFNGSGPSGGGFSSTSYAPAPPPPPHHTFQEFITNGQAITDPQYQVQKAALLGKLNDYERQVASQVGDRNIQQQNDPGHSLLGNYWAVRGLDPKATLYNITSDPNGVQDYKSAGLIGGTLGSDYDKALAAFDDQQNQGLRGLAENFAARGMLGAGSGVWQNSRANLQNQYNQQLTNLGDSAVNQYNSLLSNLADQYSQGQQSLTGYETDAANRIANTLNAGLPTTA